MKVKNSCQLSGSDISDSVYQVSQPDDLIKISVLLTEGIACFEKAKNFKDQDVP
jgi:hypothetical protein